MEEKKFVYENYRPVSCAVTSGHIPLQCFKNKADYKKKTTTKFTSTNRVLCSFCKFPADLFGHTNIFGSPCVQQVYNLTFTYTYHKYQSMETSKTFIYILNI